MNKRSWFLVFGLVMLTLVSCDEIDDPYEHLDEFISDTGDIRFNDTTFNDTTISNRVVLIEDFTGHKCPNCPAATDLAEQLKADNPGKVEVVAIHNSGNFSEPDDKFPADYRTDAGRNLREEFKIAGFPAGLINRQEWNNAFRVGLAQWENNVNTKLQDATYMELNFSVKSMNIYNTDTRVLRVIPNITSLIDEDGEIFFTVYILENNIVSPQEDSRDPNSPIIDYTHKHLLRSSFPVDEIGVKIFENPRNGNSYSTSLNSTDELRFELDSGWIPENCEVSYLIYNRTTKEVLHYEAMPLLSAGG